MKKIDKDSEFVHNVLRGFGYISKISEEIKTSIIDILLLITQNIHSKLTNL